jgi:O-antigen/teichoic acid export membrane protein
MAGVAKQTVVLTAARFANYGLMVISPIILARMLSVEQFGQYRQFMIFASFLQLVAAFSFAESLLYFVPKYSGSIWRVIDQTNLLVLLASVAVALVLAVSDLVSGGALVGRDLLPLIAYILTVVNLDFWEYFFLARNRPASVVTYTVCRLAARMLVVITVAYLTRDVRVIIWSLVLLETLRLLAAAAAWRLMDRASGEATVPGLLGEQLRFCVPTGLAMLLFMANRNLGALAVTKTLGAVALAHYTIGTYADYVYLVVGNTIAAVILPEMVRRDMHSREDAVGLWRKTTVVNTLLLLPAATLLARFAKPLIVGVFHAEYLASVPVLQIHMLFLVRACVDFAPALRAVSVTRPLIYSNMAAFLTNAVLLTILIPRMGIKGAVTALVVSSFVEAVVLARWTSKTYRITLRKLIPIAGMSKVLLATAAGAVVIIAPVWNDVHFTGVILASGCFYAVVVLVVVLLKIEEAQFLWSRLRNFALTLRGSTLRA